LPTDHLFSNDKLTSRWLIL